MSDITKEELAELYESIKPLLNMRIDWLSIPDNALDGFEPSQVAVIVNTLLDGILPQIELLAIDEENRKKLHGIGLKKAPGLLGEREGYPDYVHVSGKRVELKGLFVDNQDLKMKRPPTKREPSARVKENVTMNEIQPENDALLIAAVQLQEKDGLCSPFIVDIGIFSMVEIIRIRDQRLVDTGGRWIGNLPKVISKKGAVKLNKGEVLTDDDYEKDTNFGKLKRIPHAELQAFLKKWS
jgi:hypothetical protein